MVIIEAFFLIYKKELKFNPPTGRQQVRLTKKKIKRPGELSRPPPRGSFVYFLLILYDKY
jgi:hypothetical protein